MHLGFLINTFWPSGRTENGGLLISFCSASGTSGCVASKPQTGALEQMHLRLPWTEHTMPGISGPDGKCFKTHQQKRTKWWICDMSFNRASKVYSHTHITHTCQPLVQRPYRRSTGQQKRKNNASSDPGNIRADMIRATVYLPIRTFTVKINQR